MHVRRISGLGAAYSGGTADECYDSGRPSWLPSWIPTNSEIACRLGITKPVGSQFPSPVPAGAPSTPADIVNPGEANAALLETAQGAHEAYVAAQQQAIVDWEAERAATGGYENVFLGDLSAWFGTYKWWLIGGAAGIAVLVMAMKRR